MHDVAVSAQSRVDWKRLCFMLVGPLLFFLVYYSPPWADAVDPMGKHFPLSKEAKGAVAVFLWAGSGGSLKWCPSG